MSIHFSNKRIMTYSPKKTRAIDISEDDPTGRIKQVMVEFLINSKATETPRQSMTIFICIYIYIYIRRPLQSVERVRLHLLAPKQAARQPASKAARQPGSGS